MENINDKQKEEFKKVDEKLNKIKNETDFVSRIKTKKKVFMTISDVEPEDAIKFKKWCDKHTGSKQFLGIKVLMAIMDRVDPILTNMFGQINQINHRIDTIEIALNQPKEVIEERPKLVIPRTQGKKVGGLQ